MSKMVYDLAIVMPVYNEEATIDIVLKKWSKMLDCLGMTYQIHVYNDGSKDTTLQKIDQCAKDIKNIIPHHKTNSGHGPTILQGYRDNLDKTWIFQIDSDDEMSPDYFKTFWDERNQYDFLTGKRSQRQGPLSRKMTSLFSRLTVSIFYRKSIYDVNVPYRLMRTKSFKPYFQSLSPDIFAPNIILAGIAGLKKFRCFESEVPYHFRQTGEVSIKSFKLLKVAIKSFIQTVKERFRL